MKRILRLSFYVLPLVGFIVIWELFIWSREYMNKDMRTADCILVSFFAAFVVRVIMVIITDCIKDYVPLSSYRKLRNAYKEVRDW